jgi:hypothetical protein
MGKAIHSDYLPRLPEHLSSAIVALPSSWYHGFRTRTGKELLTPSGGFSGNKIT